MDPRIGYQVGLKLGEVHIQSTIEAKRGSDGGHNLADETVQIGVGGSLDVQVPAADVVDGLVVHHEGAVGVLQSCVGGQDGVVRLNNSSGNLRSRVDGKLELGLLSVVHGEAFHEKRGKAGASAATKGVEN